MWLDQVDTLQYFTFLVLHFKQPTKTFSFYNNTIVKYTKNTTHFLVILALDIFSSSGQQYTVSVYQVVSISTGDTREVISEPVSAVFTTKPLAPRDVSTEQGHIIISPSPSPSVKWDPCLEIRRKQKFWFYQMTSSCQNFWDVDLHWAWQSCLSVSVYHFT